MQMEIIFLTLYFVKMLLIWSLPSVSRWCPAVANMRCKYIMGDCCGGIVHLMDSSPELLEYCLGRGRPQGKRVGRRDNGLVSVSSPTWAFKCSLWP